MRRPPSRVRFHARAARCYRVLRSNPIALRRTSALPHPIVRKSCIDRRRRRVQPHSHRAPRAMDPRFAPCYKCGRRKGPAGLQKVQTATTKRTLEPVNSRVGVCAGVAAAGAKTGTPAPGGVPGSRECAVGHDPDRVHAGELICRRRGAGPHAAPLRHMSERILKAGSAGRGRGLQTNRCGQAAIRAEPVIADATACDVTGPSQLRAVS
jgi:hypothetical protein